MKHIIVCHKAAICDQPLAEGASDVEAGMEQEKDVGCEQRSCTAMQRLDSGGR